MLIRAYVWLGDRPLAVIEGGQVYYVRTDHIGRPVFATTSTGTVVWTASYLPFGGVHVTTGAPIDLRFPGQWFQAESGLYQNWMRDYDPTTGRYLEPDPLGLVDGASVYGYARQNPGRWTDLTGLCSMCVPIIVGGIEAGGGGSVTGAVIGGILLSLGIAGPAGEGSDVPPSNVVPFPRTDAFPDEIGDGCGGGDDCPAQRAKLILWFEVLVEASAEGIVVAPSALQTYIAAAKKYNVECVPKGYPPVPVSFLR